MTARRRSAACPVLIAAAALALAALPAPAAPPTRARLLFEENHGQVAASARFAARGSGLSVLAESRALRVIAPREGDRAAAGLTFVLPDADPGAILEGESERRTRVSYLAGSDPAAWIHDVRTYDAVRYRGVAPGIDLALRGDGGSLRLELHVAAGARSGVLSLRVEGADEIAPDAADGLVLHVGSRVLRLGGPVAETSATSAATALDAVRAAWASPGREQIEMRWQARPQAPASVLVAELRPDALVGPQLDEANAPALALDAGGARFVAGRAGGALATGFDAATEPWARAEAFVTKLAAGSREPEFTTYFGGGGDDAPRALAIDAAGRAVIAGETTSADFPVAGMTPASGPASDAFVLQLDGEGARPLAALRFGGEGAERVEALALDAAGRAWIGGSTDGALAATEGAAQGERGGGRDGFVAAFELATGAVAHATYLGGDGDDAVRALGIDGSGLVFVAGVTASPGWALAAAPAPAPAREAFVARLDAMSGALVEVARAGGGLESTGDALVLEPGGRVQVAGIAPAAAGSSAFEAVVRTIDGAGRVEGSRTLAGAAAPMRPRLARGADGSLWLAGRRSDGTPFAGRLAGGPDAAGPVALADSLDLAPGAVLGGLASDASRGALVSGLVDGEQATASMDLLGPAFGGGEAFVAPAAPEATSGPDGALGACPGTINFDNSAGTNLWQTTTNWDLDRLPNASDNVCISGFAVTLSANNQDAATLRVQGTGASLTISGGQLTLAGGSSEIQTTLTLSGGTLTGAGSLTIAGAFTWNGGAMSGSGTTTANGGISLGGTTLKSLTRTLQNANSQTATRAGTGVFQINSPGVFQNPTGSTFDLQSDAAINGTGLFDNAGLLRRTTSANLVTITCPLNNTGTVDVQTGTLGLGGDGTHTGDFDATGAVLRLQGGTQTLSGTSEVTGTRVEFTGSASVTISGPYDVTDTTQMSATAATFSSAATLTSLGTTLDQSNGTLTLDSGEAIALTTLSLTNGTLAGADSITVSGMMSWSGGTMSGAGVTTANGGITITGSTTRSLTRTLRNANGGTTTRSSTGILQINTPGKFQNLAGAIFDQQGDNTINGTGLFDNAGLLKRTTSGNLVSFTCPLNNTGTVDVQAGTLGLGGDGTHTGDFDATGAVLRFQGGTHTLSGTSDVTGSRVEFTGSPAVTVSGPYDVTDTTQVSNGTVSFQPAATLTSLGSTLDLSGGTLTLDSGEAVALTTLSLTNGTLAGADSVTVGGTFTWGGGTMTGGGITTANGGVTFNGSTTRFLTRTLRNANGGTATRSGTGILQINTPGTFQNMAGSIFDQQGDNAINGSGLFSNAGTFLRTTSSNPVAVSCRFDNTGLVDVQTGTLRLDDNGTHTGDFDATGAVLRFQSGTHTFAASTDITGSRVEFATATATVSGVYNVAGTTRIEGGSLSFPAAATLTSLGTGLEQTGGTLTIDSGEAVALTTLQQSNGTLTGADNVTVSGLLAWDGGTLSGAGLVTANGGMAIGGNGVKVLSRTLRNANNGTATRSGLGQLSVNATGVFQNLAGSTFDLQGDGNTIGSTGLFENAGTFRRSTSAGAVTFGVPITNTGRLEVLSGKLSLSATYTQTAGQTVVNGGVLESTVALSIQGGSVEGIGTLDANLTTGGRTGPGVSPGILEIKDDAAASARSYTQTMTGSLAVEIGGLMPGNGPDNHDQLTVSGIASLSGALSISLVNGFVPVPGDTVTILTAASRTGTFSTVTETGLPPCLIWQVDYQPTAVVLRVVQLPVEIAGARFDTSRTTLLWNPAPPKAGTTYDVVRGDPQQLPAGSVPASESCVITGTALTSVTDATTPTPTNGLWYLVRENVAGCGTGTYGFTSGATERMTSACP